MTDAFLVADVGNTRIKVGLCRSGGSLDGFAVPPDDPEVWETVLAQWNSERFPATVAGVHPAWRDRFAAWLRQRGHAVRELADYRNVPIRVEVDAPERVGIDRLLSAVAVVPHIPLGRRAVVIDAGSAVTVDLVEREGVFRGGAIFPGLRLMAQALHAYTAQLPLVDDFRDPPPLPGRNTVAAITAGVAAAVLGGIERLVADYERDFGPLLVAVTGGDAELLRSLRCRSVIVDPWLTLEGIRRTVLHAP